MKQKDVSKLEVPKIDKRIQKTKRILSESLIGLILEKGYEQISVQDILDRANVGRSTFYAHYENKEQLFLSGFQNLQIQLFSKKTTLTDAIFLPLFDHAGQNLKLAKALLGRKSGEIFTDMLRAQILEYLQKINRPRSGGKDHLRLWHYQCEAAASAVISLLKSWLHEDLVFSAEFMSEEAERIVMQMISSKVGRSAF